MGFHDDCLVFDGHTDVPSRLWEAPADLGESRKDRHVDLPRLREGGVDALVFALYVPGSLSAEAGFEHAKELHRLSLEHLTPGLELARSAEDVRRRARRGEVAVVFGLENGRPLTVPSALETFAGMGVRYVTLTHFRTHEWCDASTDAPQHGGLSREGVELVRRMGTMGILADVSHVSDDAVRHTLDVAKGPVVASHSSARALCDHPRNLPDDLIRDIARSGGVVMANTYPAFVGIEAARADRKRFEATHEELAATEDEYMRNPHALWRERAEVLARHPLPRVPFSTYVDHVIHLIEQAGEEHVGIGTDFDGIPETLEGFEDISRFPDLTTALLARGVDRSGVRLILGESFLRLLDEAERLVAV